MLVSFTSLKEELDDMRRSLHLLRTEINTQLNNPPSVPNPDDLFIQVMNPFLEEAQVKFAALDERYMTVMKMYEEVAETYGEDPAKVTPEEFLGIFATFFTGFQVGKRDKASFRARSYQY